MKKSNIVLVGAGGIASYLLPVLCRMVERATITIIDGDVLEERNLDRQAFQPKHVGMNKAEALVDTVNGNKLSLEAVPRFLTEPDQLIQLQPDTVFCLADNNRARQVCNEAAICGVTHSLIVAANEKTSWQADFFKNIMWADFQLLERYPEWDTDDGFDPARPACQNEAAIVESNGQLPLANSMAANHALTLFNIWSSEELRVLSMYDLFQTYQHLPIGYAGNGYTTQTKTFKNLTVI